MPSLELGFEEMEELELELNLLQEQALVPKQEQYLERSLALSLEKKKL